ncbi:50s ribosomal protein l17 [Quercus suber]|uniref:50s ribosomal protein l17 n=1 Tax=Quercus suber TaxID=58331 RepID=A0AAW0KHR3_QUESU
MSRDGFGRGREAKRRDGFGREREVKSRLGWELWHAQIGGEMREEAAACSHRYLRWEGGESASDSGKRFLGAEIRSTKTHGSLCAARRAAAFVREDDVIHKLFTKLAYRYKDRTGGYTILLQTRIQVGDAASMAYIE